MRDRRLGNPARWIAEPARSLLVLTLAALSLAGCSGDDDPTTGNVRVTLRDAMESIEVDTGELDTLLVTLLDSSGEPVDSTLVIAAPPLTGGTRTFDLTAPGAAGLVVLVKGIGERPVGGAPPATYVRGILRRGQSGPFDLEEGAMASVEVELTSFVTAFHNTTFMDDGARHRISWQPLPGATRWRLAITEGALAERDTVLVDTTFTASALPVTYQVQAIDADSAEGARGDLVMPGLLLPGAPVNLRLIPRTGERMEVRWNRGTGFVHDWQLERKAEEGSFLPLVTLGVDTLSFVDSTLVDGRRWEYRARSRNLNGLSAWTNTVAGLTPLNAPEGLVLTPNDLEFGLGWTERSLSEDGLIVERATGNGSFAPLATLQVNASGYTDAPLAERTRYRYRVQAFRGLVRSAYSGVVEGTTPLHVPSPPGGLSATAISPIQINVAWGAALGIVENYQVERRRPNETFTLRATVAGDMQLYADLGLPAGTTYEYRVRAVNATGPGGWSNVATATTHPAPPR